MNILVLILLGVMASPSYADTITAPESKAQVSTYLEKIFGKEEDFAFLKKRRRELNNQISALEKEVPSLEQRKAELESLNADVDADELAGADGRIAEIDQELARRGTRDPKDTTTDDFKELQDQARRLPSFIRLQDSRFLSVLNEEELRQAKKNLENKKKIYNERSGAISTLRTDIDTKSNTLSKLREELLEIEERIGLALSAGTNQYIYRTVVSLIFAAIVFYLVSRFFGVIADSPDVKKDIFGSDNGIQFITLFSIVIAVILFGILGILEANELSALLGGLSGYILGKSSTGGKTAP